MKTKTIVVATLATAAISFVAWSRWKNDKPSAAPEALPLAVKIEIVKPMEIS